LLRAVTLKGRADRHLVGGGVECGGADGGERLGDVADAEADDRFIGVRGDVGANTLGDVGEKVRGLELGVIFVDANDCRVGTTW